MVLTEITRFFQINLNWCFAFHGVMNNQSSEDFVIFFFGLSLVHSQVVRRIAHGIHRRPSTPRKTAVSTHPKITNHKRQQQQTHHSRKISHALERRCPPANPPNSPTKPEHCYH